MQASHFSPITSQQFTPFLPFQSPSGTNNQYQNHGHSLTYHFDPNSDHNIFQKSAAKSTAANSRQPANGLNPTAHQNILQPFQADHLTNNSAVSYINGSLHPNDIDPSTSSNAFTPESPAKRIKLEPAEKQGENGIDHAPFGSKSSYAPAFAPVQALPAIAAPTIPSQEPNYYRYQSILLAMLADPESPTPSLLTSSHEFDFSIDMTIDELGHDALHWAASLGRVGMSKLLIERGADVHRGNFTGATPLSRAVLVTNNHDQSSFGSILQLLAPSLRTLDHSGRTVLHHISLVAGIKGRVAASRYYLETILEYIVTHEDADFRSIVDICDVYGDTALNIAARVGNKALVQTLLDVGADRSLSLIHI